MGISTNQQRINFFAGYLRLAMIMWMLSLHFLSAEASIQTIAKPNDRSSSMKSIVNGLV